VKRKGKGITIQCVVVKQGTCLKSNAKSVEKKKKREGAFLVPSILEGRGESHTTPLFVKEGREKSIKIKKKGVKKKKPLTLGGGGALRKKKKKP